MLNDYHERERMSPFAGVTKKARASIEALSRQLILEREGVAPTAYAGGGGDPTCGRTGASPGKRRGFMGILILALLIVAVVAIFTIQNALPVSVVFLFWKFQASLAIVTFLSVLTGIVIASSIFFWLRIRRNRKEKKTGLSV